MSYFDETVRATPVPGWNVHSHDHHGYSTTWIQDIAKAAYPLDVPMPTTDYLAPDTWESGEHPE